MLTDPNTNIEEVDVRIHDDVIAFSQQERIKMLEDPETAGKLRVAVLNGLSTTALSAARNKQDDNNANADREAQLAIAKILTSINGNPFLQDSKSNTRIITEPKLPEVALVPDELTTIVADLNYDDLVY